MSKRIRVLDKSVTERIAAGEVVENPSSVVKELLENSIDAGATVIEVELEKGGKDLIRVTDNGEGIKRQDVNRAFLRHATSKLTDETDLIRLSTLGFRGEALAAIAAVSTINMITRPKDDIEGTLYTISRERDVKIEGTGCAAGTSIEVRDLFYNTPARKEYLKSDTYETSAVNDIVSRLALAHPNISFRLKSGNRTLINTPGNSNFTDTIMAVYGKNMMDNLLKISCRDEAINIFGFISTPYGTRSNRNYQSFFINKRYVRSRAISKALEDAYGTLIMVNRYPIAVLFFTLGTDAVDVNVHPMKLEVKFRDEDRIRGAVFNCVKSALERERWLAKGVQGKLFRRRDKSFVDRKDNRICTKVRDIPGRADSLQHDENMSCFPSMEKTAEYIRIDMDNNIEGSDGPKLPAMNVVGQFLRTFVLAQGDDCIYLIDQHAAHERIMYEEIIEGMQRGGVASQQLLKPLILELSPSDMEIVRVNRGLISSLGYKLDEFGVGAIRLKAIPAFLGVSQAGDFMLDLINETPKNRQGSKLTIKQDDIAMMACKRAVKANQSLAKEEIESLLEQLDNTKMPYTCPHGRPVIITITRYELEKMFKRIV